MSYHRLAICALLLHFATYVHQGVAQGILRRTYYDTAREFPKEEYYLKDSISNLIEGPFKQYYQSSKIASNINYVNSIPSGPALYYFENGNLKMKGELFNGRSMGVWEYFFESGQKSMSGVLNDGTRQGEWRFYFENGNLKSRGNFNQGVREGIWNYFYEDGSIKAQAIYSHGSGNYQEFYNTGKLKMEGRNEEGKSEGKWVFYYESGEVEAVGFYEQGLKSGAWKYYHKNGTLSGLGYYDKGDKNGRWTYYYEDGKVSSEGEESGGVKDGYWKLYHETGALKGEISYAAGSGQYLEYYENGHLKIRGTINNGQHEGYWQYYAEDSKLEGEANFAGGVGNYKGYYPSGTIKMEGQLLNNKRIGEWKLYNQDGTFAGTYQPIYEDEDPIFFTKESLAPTRERLDYNKPAYKFKNKNSKYFRERINEYKGLIFSVDPFSAIFGRPTAALEMYFQERLGYELQGGLQRDPFFGAHSSLPENTVYTQGSTLKLRQRFYHPEADFGMFYFGHEVGYSILNHNAKVMDTLSGFNMLRTIGIAESRWQYGIFVGNRWMQRVGDTGFTFDIYFGMGIGKRIQKKDYVTAPNLEFLSKKIDSNPTFFPILFGIQIGYAGIKPKSKY